MNVGDIRAKYGNQSSKDITSPEIEELMVQFAYSHLPEELRGASQQFYDLASNLVADNTPTHNPSLLIALEKLVEAKDWAVRAYVRTKGLS